MVNNERLIYNQWHNYWTNNLEKEKIFPPHEGRGFYVRILRQKKSFDQVSQISMPLQNYHIYI